MLTPDTVIDAPSLAPGRSSWTGTIADAYDTNDRMWATLGELLYHHARLPDGMDDNRRLAEALTDLAQAGMTDWELASQLFDDPNVRIVGPDDSLDEEAVSALRDEATAEETSGITVYTTPGCPGCQMTHRAFEKAGVDVTVIDLSTRPDLVEAFKSEGLTSAPILEGRDGARTSGFRPDRIRALIAASAPVARDANNASNAGNTGKAGSTPGQPLRGSSTENLGMRL
ncbi:glutaredoxin domain-containing protein [Schaalia hyovaginalis]|uniref:glutaredoxin domain-containing protein n=1 Tax=Schaalia hyovaginalis TaxID=29316 RepID=UPI0026F33C96|nr:glutaredoxin domain-containing protein [Schaalia hyovaginalis]MCI7513479.1 hypothetical protein [Schaalia hyovaginalis]MDY3666351.1 glutaredoxin domain-containing protein [Schaalia hyovaginalis]MDY4491559.1 glutaredoxin domain-containing protein [Schaalia hyovaginalis]